MAKKLKQGDEVNTYTILEHMHSGGMALSYRARNLAGEIVFLKQYKSPSVRVDWYRGYVAYQEEIRRRIESSAARNFCYRFIDFFEAKAGAQTYFQVFEFVTGSEDIPRIEEEVIPALTENTFLGDGRVRRLPRLSPSTSNCPRNMINIRL